MTELLSRPACSAAALLALAHLDEAIESAPRLAEEHGSESGFHDFRVALRKLRSSLRAYRKPLGKVVSKKLALRVRALAASTNEARDVEVQLEWLRARRADLPFAERAGLEWLVAHLQHRRLRAHREARERIAEDFPPLAQRLRERLAAAGEVARGKPLVHAARKALVRLGEALAEALSRVRSETDAGHIHGARIAAKRLRYLIRPLDPSHGARSLI